jgi:hypothetical protein
MHTHPILSLIDGLVGNDRDESATRLYSYEAGILKDALRFVPAVLWAGPWQERELAWVRAEVAEMFEEGTTNAFALRPRLAQMKIKLPPPDRAVVESLAADFLRRFQRGLEARALDQGTFATRLRRSLFVKTLFVLCLTTRGRPLLVLLDGGGQGRRKPEMERQRLLQQMW